MSKHTPGPWTVAGCGDDEVRANGAALAVTRIATRDGYAHSEEEDRANARLVAAAPELLHAAKAAQEVIAACIPHDTKVPVPGVSRLLRDAIAKAEGDK